MKQFECSNHLSGVPLGFLMLQADLFDGAEFAFPGVLADMENK